MIDLGEARQQASLARNEVIQAVELVDSARHLASLISVAADGTDGLPVKPVELAIEHAMEEAFEALLSWRTACETYHKAIMEVTKGK